MTDGKLCRFGGATFARYKYDTVVQVFQNDTASVAACVDPLKAEDGGAQMEMEPTVEDTTGEKVFIVWTRLKLRDDRNHFQSHFQSHHR